MSIKRVLNPTRVRQIPAQFSWVDQRLVRHHFIGACDSDALALYLFLITVADAKGLSYYSDQSMMRRLACFDPARLANARSALQQVGWIAYESPVYQVLALDKVVTPPQQQAAVVDGVLKSSKPLKPRRTAQSVEAIQLLRRALEDRHD